MSKQERKRGDESLSKEREKNLIVSENEKCTKREREREREKIKREKRKELNKKKKG